MTVALQIQHADRADDLTEVADAVGVFVAPDLTVRQPVPVDQTGGLERLREILDDKTSANDVVVVDDATIIPVTESMAARARRALRTVRAWASRAVKVARDALAWLTEPIGVIAERARWHDEPGDYAGRHRTAQAWYGVQRSTASRVAIQRRRQSGRQPADSEPALPEHWVSYVALMIETVRGHEDALHPRAGYQFRC